MRSPIRWVGGKHNMSSQILEFIPQHRSYVETCCGGAGLFWAKPKNWSSAEILNDVDGELINFYSVLHKRGRRLAMEVDTMPYSRRLFGEVRESRPRSAFARARRFWYLNRVAFGGQRRSPAFGVSVSHRAYVLPSNLLRDLDRVIERLRGVSFEAVDVVHLLKLYDRSNTLFFVDPPYYGLSQPYIGTFIEADHERLADCLRDRRGPWLLTYNDCSDVRRLYRGCRLRSLNGCYSIASNSSNRNRSEAQQLLISNRPFRREQNR